MSDTVWIVLGCVGGIIFLGLCIYAVKNRFRARTIISNETPEIWNENTRDPLQQAYVVQEQKSNEGKSYTMMNTTEREKFLHDNMVERFPKYPELIEMQKALFESMNKDNPTQTDYDQVKAKYEAIWNFIDTNTFNDHIKEGFKDAFNMYMIGFNNRYRHTQLLDAQDASW